MKISFVLVAIDHLAGTERAAVAQANALAPHHEVEIISLLRHSPHPRTDVDPRVHIRYLTSTLEGPGVEVEYPISDANALAERPSLIVPSRWDPTLNALCDVAIQAHLPTMDSDLVVTLTHGMLCAATQLLPQACALVHQEHRSSMHRTSGIEPLLAFGPRADAIVSLTEVNARWLRENLAPYAPPIFVVPNAAPPAGQPQSRLDQPVIMAAGRLDAEKQHEHLIRAFARIADDLPGWRVRIFGVGARRQALMNVVQRCKLYDRVELPGVTHDLASEWAGASMAVLTSRREGFPLVVLESFAAGLPVVSYDCPTGPSELIEHGANGLLVRQDDESDLARQMLLLAQDHGLRQRMGQAALASLARFDSDAITAQWERIYADAVTHRQTRVSRPHAFYSSETRRTESQPAEPVRSSSPLTPRDQRRALLSAATSLLGDVNAWFVLPARGASPPILGVESAVRDVFLKRLRSADLPDGTHATITQEDYWASHSGPFEPVLTSLASSIISGLLLGPAPHDPEVPHGDSGIRIEFWSRDVDGIMRAPSQNGFVVGVSVEDIRAGIDVDGIQVQGLPGLVGPYAHEVTFPVDVVYTWVDDGDLEWQKARLERMATAEDPAGDQTSSGDARYRNRDELRYSLRSIHAHAPWVRDIYVVTAGQRPQWLSDHPRVHVVDHQEILPEDALPTFNSHAIEAALHRIEGLSEHFIYFNDDVFLGRPLSPERFFSPGGLFAVFPSADVVGLPGADDRPFMSAARNNRRLLQSRFGATTTLMMAHAPHPQRRSVLTSLCRDFHEDVERTKRSPFRSRDDVSVTASLAQHYGILSGDAYVAAIDSTLLDTSKPGIRPKLRKLLARDQETFCLADQHDYWRPQEVVEQLLHEFLEEYFPVPGPWER